MQAKLVLTFLLAIATVANGQNEPCGGLAIEESGEIVYKASSTYDNYEACTWTVRSGLATSLRFTLVQDGFESGYDFLTIATFEDYDRADIQVQAQLEAGDRQPVVVNGPVAFITFQTDSSVTGTGFRLQFEAVGNTTRKDLDDYVFSHTTSYPSGASEARYPVSDPYYSSWEFVTYVIQPPRVPNEAVQSYLVLEEVDIENSADCVNDSLDINTVYYGGVIRQGRVCPENWNGTELYGSAGPWVLVFRSNANDNHAGFQGSFKLTFP